MKAAQEKKEGEIFDDWPDRYDSWFETPIGRLVKKYETEVLLEMLQPSPGEMILDVGCGTGVFTKDVLTSGADVIGLDLSFPMLKRAVQKMQETSYKGLVGTMTALPFPDESFDKTFSMTAVEFVEDIKTAVNELNRVTKKKGVVVLTTLNSRSPWAERRIGEGRKGHTLFENMTFRSPIQMAELVGVPARIKTAIHFLKNDKPEEAEKIEQQGKEKNSDTGAFLALAWEKVC